MIISIFLIIVGILVLAAGIYYHQKDKDDPSSRGVYTKVSIAGAVILVIGAVSLFL